MTAKTKDPQAGTSEGDLYPPCTLDKEGRCVETRTFCNIQTGVCSSCRSLRLSFAQRYDEGKGGRALDVRDALIAELREQLAWRDKQIAELEAALAIADPCDTTDWARLSAGRP